MASIGPRRRALRSSGRWPTLNRTQALVLGFCLLAWISLIVILAAAPEVYDEMLPPALGHHWAVKIVFVVALSGFLALLSIGVFRRWRWTFWLILVAFMFGLVRAPVAVLQLTGTLQESGPTWYAVLQGAIGLVQFAIALVMLAGYRRAGVWGSS